MRYLWLATVLALLGLFAAILPMAGCGEDAERNDSDSDADTDADAGSDAGDADAGDDEDSGPPPAPCVLTASETFDSQLPSDWSFSTQGVGHWNWHGTTYIPAPWYLVPAGGLFIDSQAAGIGYVQDDDVITASYEIGGCSSVEVTIEHCYMDHVSTADSATVYVVPGGTGAPVEIQSFTTSTPAQDLTEAVMTFDASELGGEDTFTLMFHYSGNNTYGWFFDNFSIEGKE